ncbi:hypothetical protein An08g05170 [Aspergillus niger]|uniref:Uncharacterized protein n=2 Tax=Aspergillus niger TaxID=5061 RepID=A2QR88_ASPNC|nr:hypothetical protein An08g05170 [Aspergillus niger]CAK45489.1 hypothetical protein An08g05170 [Aspergillus niger]
MITCSAFSRTRGEEGGGKTKKKKMRVPKRGRKGKIAKEEKTEFPVQSKKKPRRQAIQKHPIWMQVSPGPWAEEIGWMDNLGDAYWTISAQFAFCVTCSTSADGFITGSIVASGKVVAESVCGLPEMRMPTNPLGCGPSVTGWWEVYATCCLLEGGG